MRKGSIVFDQFTGRTGVITALTKKGVATVMLEESTLKCHVDFLGLIEKSVFDLIRARLEAGKNQ